jgi:hypothetical protein
MRIKNKSKFLQLICKHDYKEGIISQPYFNLSGNTYTTVADFVKAGD